MHCIATESQYILHTLRNVRIKKFSSVPDHNARKIVVNLSAYTNDLFYSSNTTSWGLHDHGLQEEVSTDHVIIM